MTYKWDWQLLPPPRRRSSPPPEKKVKVKSICLMELFGVCIHVGKKWDSTFRNSSNIRGNLFYNTNAATIENGLRKNVMYKETRPSKSTHYNWLWRKTSFSCSSDGLTGGKYKYKFDVVCVCIVWSTTYYILYALYNLYS